MNKPVYIAKWRQRFDKTLNFFVARAKSRLKDLYMVSHGTKYNTNSWYYSSIELLLINSVTAIPF